MRNDRRDLAAWPRFATVRGGHAAGGECAQVDEFDRRILAALQQNNLTPADRIGAEIGLSPSAVQRRIKRLRDDGIIRADVSVVEPAAVGRAVTLIVEVSLERERADLIEAFKREMRQSPEVQQCYYVTGSADFMLVVTAPDMAAYEDFTRRKFFDNPNIRGFRTSVVMDRVKVGLAVPMEP